MSVTMPFFMSALKSLSDKHRCQVGEDISLYKRNKDFDQINKDSQQDKERRGSPAQSRIHRSENKDQDDKAQDDNMPRNHIGKKTDDQREGLGKNPHDLHRDHDGLYTDRNRRV